MTNSSRKARRAAWVFAAMVLALGGAFFVFYEARLLVVTRGLQTIRAGGRGAYIGAVAFPLIALGFAWGARRCGRAARPATVDQGAAKAGHLPGKADI